MKRPELPIYGMDAFDVEGVCFAHFSIDDWLAGRARRYLEDMIVAAGDDYISPATISTAFFYADMIIFRNLPADERRRRIEAAKAERSKRLRARGIFPGVLAPKPKPKADIWAGCGLDDTKIGTSSTSATAADLAF